MEPEMTCTSNDTTEKMKLYMAMELSQKEWKLGFSVGPGLAPCLLAVAGRNLDGLMNEIRLTRERFGLGVDVEDDRVLSAAIDANETAAAKSGIADKLARLRRGEHRE